MQHILSATIRVLKQRGLVPALVGIIKYFEKNKREQRIKFGSLLFPFLLLLSLVVLPEQ